MDAWKGPLERVDKYRWRIPKSYREGMLVDGLVYADAKMMQHIRGEQALEQVANVAFLPGIVGHSLAMPDIHWGYGFPIGGVAAMRLEDGVVSPGGVGFDINCGVRLLRTNLTEDDVHSKIGELVEGFFRDVPSGLGSKGRIKLAAQEIDRVLEKGSRWAVDKGFGRPEDLGSTEDRGEMPGADASKVSRQAKERGTPQLGTLGSGNHFLEVDVVDEIRDTETAAAMGIDRIGQVLVLIHTGSRGLGHQVCTDYVKLLVAASKKYQIRLPDRQLACAPLKSAEGKDYLAAMACAANYAWANRQCIAHWVRRAFCDAVSVSEKEAGLELVYDVAHNIARIEEHHLDGNKMKLCVNRKGATRALPPGHQALPARYAKVGQPVLIPGDMGRYSFVLVGTNKAMEQTFGSTCHGAGRLLSRVAAKKRQRGPSVLRRLEDKGISVRTGSIGGLAEEASEAYKDVADVVNIVHQSGISRIVARSKPIGVIKG